MAKFSLFTIFSVQSFLLFVVVVVDDTDRAADDGSASFASTPRRRNPALLLNALFLRGKGSSLLEDDAVHQRSSSSFRGKGESRHLFDGGDVLCKDAAVLRRLRGGKDVQAAPPPSGMQRALPPPPFGVLVVRRNSALMTLAQGKRAMMMTMQIGNGEFTSQFWMRLMMMTTHHHLLRRAGVGGATASWPVPKASSSSRRRRREDFFVRGALPDDDDDDDAKNASSSSSSSSWKEDPVAAVFKRMYAPNAGKRIAYGIFLKPIDDDSFSAANNLKTTEEEKARLRDKARQEMTVIDEEERKRRGTLCSLFFENGALCISFLFVFANTFTLHFVSAGVADARFCNRNHRSRLCLCDRVCSRAANVHLPPTRIRALGSFSVGVPFLRIPRVGTERHVKHSASRRLGRRR